MIKIGQSVTALLHRLGEPTPHDAICIGIGENETRNAPGGEPSISLLLVDTKNIKYLSTTDWTEGIGRHVDVLHDSHPDAEGGVTGITYREVEPTGIVLSADEKGWFITPAELAALSDRLAGVGTCADGHELISYLAERSEKASKLETDLSTAQANASKATGERDTLQEEVATLNTKVAELTAQLQEAQQALADATKEASPAPETDTETSDEPTGAPAKG
jgi:RNase P/RNase MRP subunit p29